MQWRKIRNGRNSTNSRTVTRPATGSAGAGSSPNDVEMGRDASPTDSTGNTSSTRSNTSSSGSSNPNAAPLLQQQPVQA